MNLCPQWSITLENFRLRNEKSPWTKCPFRAQLLEAPAELEFKILRYLFLLFEGSGAQIHCKRSTQMCEKCHFAFSARQPCFLFWSPYDYDISPSLKKISLLFISLHSPYCNSKQKKRKSHDVDPYRSIYIHITPTTRATNRYHCHHFCPCRFEKIKALILFELFEWLLCWIISRISKTPYSSNQEAWIPIEMGFDSFELHRLAVPPSTGWVSVSESWWPRRDGDSQGTGSELTGFFPGIDRIFPTETSKR